MAFWSAWFAPKCPECGTKMTGERRVFDEREVCVDCHAQLVQAEEQRQRALEERRLAEEAARAKFEQQKSFGGDPRRE